MAAATRTGGGTDFHSVNGLRVTGRQTRSGRLLKVFACFVQEMNGNLRALLGLAFAARARNFNICINGRSRSGHLKGFFLKCYQRLRLLALGDVVKAIDCSGDFSPVVLQRTDIDEDGDMRAVGPLDEHFPVMDCGYFARDHLGHGTLVVGHKTAVRPEHFERAAKPLVSIPQCWLASPQLGGVAVEVPNHARGINAYRRPWDSS